MPPRTSILDQHYTALPDHRFQCPACLDDFSKSRAYAHEPLRASGECARRKLAEEAVVVAQAALAHDQEAMAPDHQDTVMDGCSDADPSDLEPSEDGDWQLDNEAFWGFDDRNEALDEWRQDDQEAGGVDGGSGLTSDGSLLESGASLYGSESLTSLESLADSDESSRTSPWLAARGRLVHDGNGPNTDLTVLQAAFMHVDAVHRGRSIAEAELAIKENLRMYSPACGKPAPDNPLCRYPPSYHVCKLIVGVDSLDDYEYHVCECGKVFPQRPLKWCKDHSRICSNASCRFCRCSCGGARLTSPEDNSDPEPVSPCYFFPDVLHQFFEDDEWYVRARAAHRTRSGAFFKNPEGQRVLRQAKAAGAKESEVRLDQAKRADALTLCTSNTVTSNTAGQSVSIHCVHVCVPHTMLAI